MCRERKNILRQDSIARQKGLKTHLLSDSEREDLTRRVADDRHAIDTYFKRIEGHYDGYLECKNQLEEIKKKQLEEIKKIQELKKNTPAMVRENLECNVHYQQESIHYIRELERNASTLVHQCTAFQSFSEGNYKLAIYLLKKKKDKDIVHILDEIKEKYDFRFHGS